VAPPIGESNTQNGNEPIGQPDGLPKGVSNGINHHPEGAIEPSKPGPGDIVENISKSEMNKPGAKSFN
jgi:hypothetical protein